MLGAHPHGNAPIVGRHATTPVRMSTPRVPEHGGEMSAAQLQGLEDSKGGASTTDFGQSRSFNRRSSLLTGHPPRPQSVNQVRCPHRTSEHGGVQGLRPPSRAQTPANASTTASARKPSFGEDGSGLHRTLKMYPVLDLPNRQPTHDRYDAGWGLGNDGIAHLLPTSQATNEQQEADRDYKGTKEGQTQRKKLFYFDTT